MESIFYPSIRDIVEAMNTLFQERQIHSENLSQLKCLEEGKKMRFFLQMKSLVLHSLVRTWNTISEVILAMNVK